MKILAIRGYNIASLADEFEIDFTKEPLVSSGIFAITGPTGSGKSTILDILCLALYEKTPRLNNAKGTPIADVNSTTLQTDNVATLLRRGTGEGYAEVDFVGIDGKSYRSRWSVRRARGKADQRLQNTEVQLINLTDNQPFGEKKNTTLLRIVELIGLTFDQFTRAVLLAQGDFANFLKSDENDRATLLEKLTGTEIYSNISSKIYQNAQKAYIDFQQVKTRMSEHHLLSEEDLTQQKGKMASLTQQIKEVDSQLNILIKQRDWYGQLARFQKQISDADAALEDNQSLLNQQLPTRALLLELDRVSEAIPVWHELQKILTECNTIQNKKAEIAKKMTQLTTEAKSLSLKEKEVKGDYETFITGEDILMRQLREARDLDVQLKMSHDNLLSTQKTFADIQQKIEHKIQTVTQIQSLMDSAQSSFDDANKWLQANDSRRAVAEHVDLILQHLQSAAAINESLTAIQRQLKQEGESINDLETELNILQLKLKEQQLQLSDQEKQKAELDREITLLNYEQLEKERKETIAQKQKLSDLMFLAQKIVPLKKDISTNEQQIQQESAQLTTFCKQLEECTGEQLILQGKVEQAAKTFMRFQQMISQNVEHLRANLTAGEACPVCGSKEHPFAKQMDQLLRTQCQEAQSEKEIQDAAYRNIQQQVTKLETEIKNKEQHLNLLTQSCQDFHTQLTLLEKDWAQKPLSAQFALQTDLSLVDSIAKASQEVAQLNEQLDNKIASYYSLSNKRKEINELSEKIKESQAQLSIAQTAKNERINALRRNGDILRTREKEVNQSLTNDLLAVNGFFQNADWQENWRKDADLFIQKMNAFAIQWKAKNELRENASKTLSEQSKVRETEQTNLHSFRQDQRAIESVMNQKQTEYDQVVQRRKQLFNGQPADTVEQTYQAEKAKKNNACLSIAKEIQQQEQAIATLNGQDTALQIQLNERTEQSQYQHSLLDSFIDHYNHLLATATLIPKSQEENESELLSLLTPLTIEHLKELASLSTEKISDKRKMIAQLEKEKLRIESVRITHSQNLCAHQQSRPLELDEAATEKQLTLSTDQKTTLEADRAVVQASIAQHDANEKQLEALGKEMKIRETNYRNWQKLNDLIGSQTGNKFKKIAQSYTLDLLLQTANAHMRNIAPRYRLQRIPESLSLQVIDKDMCDQIRSVHSLSGGETFLVSLSLALGLSSLSSSQMNIESLFIDEGFGSLDEESLITALEALDSLRMQGRKVGVITHVKEMMERLNTQIQVIKQHNGASIVQVI